MSLRLLEYFGFSPADVSAVAQEFRRTESCPFVEGACVKRFQRGIVSGACTAKPITSGPVIICPNRLYAGNYRILRDIAISCFGADARLCRNQAESRQDGNDVFVFGKKWGKELRLPSRGISGGYFVDWILAKTGPDGSLLEFVAVEVQTMDTTGSYGPEVMAYRAGEIPEKPSKAGINWENVSKRILPQIIYKGNVLRREPRCTKGLFLVCPAPVYSRLIERLGDDLADYHPQSGALTFRWYDVALEASSGSNRELLWKGSRTTTIDQVALAFTAPKNLPPSGVYETAIKAALSGL